MLNNTHAPSLTDMVIENVSGAIDGDFVSGLTLADDTLTDTAVDFGPAQAARLHRRPRRHQRGRELPQRPQQHAGHRHGQRERRGVHGRLRLLEKEAPCGPSPGPRRALP
jgi:hypothetical protein